MSTETKPKNPQPAAAPSAATLCSPPDGILILCWRGSYNKTEERWAGGTETYKPLAMVARNSTVGLVYHDGVNLVDSLSPPALLGNDVALLRICTSESRPAVAHEISAAVQALDPNAATDEEAVAASEGGSLSISAAPAGMILLELLATRCNKSWQHSARIHKPLALAYDGQKPAVVYFFENAFHTTTREPQGRDRQLELVIESAAATRACTWGQEIIRRDK